MAFKGWKEHKFSRFLAKDCMRAHFNTVSILPTLLTIQQVRKYARMNNIAFAISGPKGIDRMDLTDAADSYPGPKPGFLGIV